MKKEWKNAEMTEVDLKDTQHNWTGIYRDGGYIGDGEISGHLSWTKDEDKKEPINPADRLSN